MAAPQLDLSTLEAANVAIPQLHERLNTVCPYFTMFPLDFPLRVLADAKPGQWALDPFCGRGTTMYAARLRGLGSVGIDANPVAAAIAAAKVAPIDPARVEALAVKLLTATHEPNDVPTGKFWDLAYHPQTLRDLCSLREQLAERGDDPATVALRAIALGILHGPLRKGEPSYLSNQMPRTYATKPDAAVRYWAKRDLQPPYVRVLDVVLRRIRYTLTEVPASTPGQVHCGDSAKVLPRLRRRFDWVITSPPYYQMRTYLPDQWVRNWFVGGPATVDYRATNQISHHGIDGFTKALAVMWARVAERCNPGAQLAVRFGALPSVQSSAKDILTNSLAQANAGWVVREIVDAGEPRQGRRQAAHMAGAGEYAPEIDCFAVLGE